MDEFLRRQLAREALDSAQESVAQAGQGALGSGAVQVFDSSIDTDPDSFGSSFSSSYEGFGPGDYSGGYTGDGDRVYWGPYGDRSDAGGLPVHSGPGVLLKQGTEALTDALAGSVGTSSAGGGADANQGGLETIPEYVPPSSHPSIGTTDVTEAASSRGSLWTKEEIGSIAGSRPGSRPNLPQSEAARSRQASIAGETDAEPFTGDDPAIQSHHGSEWGGRRVADVSTLPDIPDIPEFVDPLDVPAGGTSSLGVPSLGPVVGDVEMQPMGQDLGYDSSVYSGDSYHGSYQRITPYMPGPDEAPHLLSEMPTPSEDFGWEKINWNEVPESFKSDIGSYLSSDVGIDNSFLGSDGIGSSLGLFSRNGFANFLQSRMVDVGVGVALQPLFNFIDDSTDTPWVSRGIQGALGLYGLVASEDPFGIIALPFMWGINELNNQASRKLDNDHPDANYGKQYGFVREGTKWYPAYLTRLERDEGTVGSARTQFRMSYGQSIKFKREKATGRMIPYFDEGTYRQKDFHAWDDEVDITNEMSGKKWRDTADPLRDFYFLNDQETTDFLHGIAGGDTLAQYHKDDGHEFSKAEQETMDAARAEAWATMSVHDDVSWEDTWAEHGTAEQQEYYNKYGTYVGSLQDLRSGFELMQDYRTSDPGSIHTASQDENMYEGSKALRRNVNDFAYLGYQDQMKAQGSRTQGTDIATSNLERTPKEWGSFIRDPPEADYLLDEYDKQWNALLGAQKRAFESMNMKYSTDAGADLKWLHPSVMPKASADGSISISEYDRLDNQSVDRYGQRLYLDGSFEIGDTSSAAGLQQALRRIEAAGDSSLFGTHDYRSAAQRDYLAQKAWVRYLAGKVNDMGLGGDVRARAISIGNSHEWGLHPTYSYADDFEKYGYLSPVERVRKTSDQTFDVSKETPEWLQKFYDAGFLDPTDPTTDPDYIAGRFTDVSQFVDVPQEEEQVQEPVVQEPVVQEQVQGVGFGDLSMGGAAFAQDEDYGAPSDPIYGEDYPETFTYDRYTGEFVGPDGTRYAPNDPEMWRFYEKELADEKALEEKIVAEQVAADAAYDKKQTTVPDTDPSAGQHIHDEDGAAHVHDYVPVHHDVDRHFSRGTAPAHIPIATIAADIADSKK